MRQHRDFHSRSMARQSLATAHQAWPGKHITGSRAVPLRAVVAFAWVAMLALGVGCGGTQKADEELAERETTTQPAAEQTPREDEQQPDQPAESAADRSAREEAEAEARAERRRAALEDAVARAREGEFASAQTDLSQLLDDPELGPHAAYNLGVIAYYKGEEQTARRYFDRALELDPAFGPAASAIVRNYLRAGNESAARQFVREQLVKSDNSPAIMAVQLLIPLRNKNYEQVIAQAREIFMQDPSNLDAHYALALANMGLERYELAKYILQQGLTRDPNRVELKFALARLAMIENNTVRAKNLLNEVLAEAPFHPEANNNLGVINIQTSNYEEAVDNLERATRSAPWFADAWLNLGDAYKHLRRYQDAREAFQRASRANTSMAEPYFNLGILYMDVPDFERLDRIGRMETALDYFTQYRQLAGTLPPDHRVFEYIREAEQIIETQRQLDQQPPTPAPAAEPESSDDGFGDFFEEEGGDSSAPSDEGGQDEGGQDDGSGDDGFGDFEWE